MIAWERRGLVLVGREVVASAEPTPKAVVDLHSLVACPTCGARVDESCRTSGGNPASSHVDRLAPRLCPCGELATPNATMCNPCRAQSRRVTWRTAQARMREKRRARPRGAVA